MWPVSGIEISAPAAMQRRQTPIVAFETSRWSCSHGMCAIQVPIIAPLIAKTENVAQRGVTSSRPGSDHERRHGSPV